MDFQTWAGFAAASLAVLLVPGPMVVLVVSSALNRGRRTALPLAWGTVLGDATMMTAVLLGAGALLALHAALFTALRWAGAAYLAWLGLSLWRAAAPDGAAGPGGAEGLRLVGQTWLAVVLNPITGGFFLAFLPQFVDPGRGLLAQLVVLEATFMGLAFAVTLFYALLAARLGEAVASSAPARMLRRTGGAALIGTGLWLAVGSA